MADIRPRDVVRHLKVSRSLADERFRKMMGRSLGEEITRVQLDAVKKKLLDTDIPIGTMTDLCGFTAPNYLKRLFKQNFGMSMKQFRDAHKPSIRIIPSPGVSPVCVWSLDREKSIALRRSYPFSVARQYAQNKIK